MEKVEKAGQALAPVVPHLPHSRHPAYRVEVANGATLTESPSGSGRFELDFFADRFLNHFEEMVRIDGNDGAFRATGVTHGSPVREHMVGVSLVEDDLRAIAKLINEVLEQSAKRG